MDVMHVFMFVLGLYCGLKTDEWQRKAQQELDEKENEK